MRLRSRAIGEQNGSHTATAACESANKGITASRGRSPWGLRRVLGGLLGVYVGIPVLVKLCPSIMAHVVFAQMLRWPLAPPLTDLEAYGLSGARNFYLPSTDGIKLGVWHILPADLKVEKKDEASFNQALSQSNPVILYLHGNSNTRGGSHRVDLYKIFAGLNYHVVSFDYRGYGDSTGSPTEEGICEDALVVHSWVKKHAGNSPVFLWGHSLGTGVTSKITRKLCEEGNCPAGVVLEAPFTSTREECSGHPFAQPWRYFPWFDWFFTDGLEANNIYFESDKHVAAITCPLLILHAEDDFIVPFRLGKKLYEIAKETRPKGAPPVHFIGYDRSHGYGHKYICNSPALPQVIREFVEGLPQKV
ncbi:PREDICTED: monoacylglycerol lipase ABHD12-like [Branchiostoma belcheri]|uniref:Monoacylglycerol lipase ABHD12-like n=1 Tax=Branchiostoma belcheri TaxID=7741 RepID=A0A6P4Z548_BRABE|nr:PREDICTED: monoacylglycerol lipase ABHD12-like [Branchiostoma belcheri]